MDSQSLLQHFSLKTSVLWCLAFLMVQLSHPYMITGKNIALTIWTFISKMMSLLFNMLSRFVTVFLPRSKSILILWLQPPSTGIWWPRKIKSVTVSIFSPFYLPWSDGARCYDLPFFECWDLSQLFHSPLSPSSTKASFSLLSAIRVISSDISYL